MVLHVSKDFANRFKCRLSLVGRDVPQTGREDSWSAHLFRLGSKPLVLAMHDHSLWSLIIPVRGLTVDADFLAVFLPRVQAVWMAHGAVFDAANQSMIFVRRTNRSLIGSMNDAIGLIKHHHETARTEGRMLDLDEVEHWLHSTPFSAIGMDSPDQKLKAMFAP